MDELYEVVQILETNERVYGVFTGTMEECVAWIDSNFDNFPESGFYIEKVQQ